MFREKLLGIRRGVRPEADDGVRARSNEFGLRGFDVTSEFLAGREFAQCVEIIILLARKTLVVFHFVP